MIKGTIIFTDIVNSSMLWNKNPTKMMKLLNKHDNIIHNIAKDHKGLVLKTIGDSFMIYIKNYKDAIYLSMDIIEKIDFLDLRIGLCNGLLNQKTNNIQNCSLKDFYGTTVNLAGRMESKNCKK